MYVGRNKTAKIVYIAFVTVEICGSESAREKDTRASSLHTSGSLAISTVFIFRIFSPAKQKPSAK